MDDRELLELAAKAAGIYGRISWNNSINQPLLMGGEKPKSAYQTWGNMPPVVWNPLTDDGDALRLAVKLRMDVTFNAEDVFAFPQDGSDGCSEAYNVEEPYAATRRAIVRAAAEIGKAMA